MEVDSQPNGRLRAISPTRRMVNLKDPSVLDDNNRLAAVGELDG